MNNLNALRTELSEWKKQLAFYKVEVIFLNNICSRAFNNDALELLSEIKEISSSLAPYEESLERIEDSFNSPSFQEGLQLRAQEYEKMITLDYKFHGFKTLCKKLSYSNLGLY